MEPRKYPPKYNPKTVLSHELNEPTMTSQDWNEFTEGINLFNTGKFWHAHEVWEEVWKRKWEPNRLFFQGLIHMTAVYHQLYNHKYHGVIKHSERAISKLELFQPLFLKVDVTYLLNCLKITKKVSLTLGQDLMHQFDTALIPVIRYR